MLEEYTSQARELTANFLTEIKDEFVAYLDVNNRNATGQSRASIQTRMTDTGGQVVAGSWIEWVFTGRGPGGMPPLSKIIDWLNARGLPRAMAWNIAKKIEREGTELFKEGGKNTNAFTEILTPERIQAFAKNIADLLAVEIASDIKGVFVNGTV